MAVRNGGWLSEHSSSNSNWTTITWTIIGAFN
uniref:Calcium-dependent protein kinase n=1 Tax=Citrus sinensis TaxID=2711 RepID=Q700T1_CITSI|nr:calcium-dependent protein kinase [Citrus sinensis]